MRAFSWIAAIPLLAGCASIDEPRVPPMVATGPAKYEVPGTTIVRIATEEEIALKCKESAAIGCTLFSPGGAPTLILMPAPWLYPDDPYARIFDHEWKHWFGWPANHPDAVQPKPASP